MGIGCDQEASLPINFGVKQGIADGDPQVGNLKLLILEIDQHHRRRVGPGKLLAFSIQTVKYSAGSGFLFFIGSL